MPKYNPEMLLTSVTNIVSAAIEYGKIKEEEITKRVEIISSSNEKIEKIRASKEIFLKYLEAEYKERYVVYSELFKQLDQAIEKQQTEVVSIVMNGIVEQIKKNPFDNFTNFKEALDDKSTKLEL